MFVGFHRCSLILVDYLSIFVYCRLCSLILVGSPSILVHHHHDLDADHYHGPDHHQAYAHALPANLRGADQDGAGKHMM